MHHSELAYASYTKIGINNPPVVGALLLNIRRLRERSSFARGKALLQGVNISQSSKKRLGSDIHRTEISTRRNMRLIQAWNIESNAELAFTRHLRMSSQVFSCVFTFISHFSSIYACLPDSYYYHQSKKHVFTLLRIANRRYLFFCNKKFLFH